MWPAWITVPTVTWKRQCPFCFEEPKVTLTESLPETVMPESPPCPLAPFWSHYCNTHHNVLWLQFPLACLLCSTARPSTESSVGSERCNNGKYHCQAGVLVPENWAVKNEPLIWDRWKYRSLWEQDWGPEGNQGKILTRYSLSLYIFSPGATWTLP